MAPVESAGPSSLLDDLEDAVSEGIYVSVFQTVTPSTTVLLVLTSALVGLGDSEGEGVGDGDSDGSVELGRGASDVVDGGTLEGATEDGATLVGGCDVGAAVVGPALLGLTDDGTTADVGPTEVVGSTGPPVISSISPPTNEVTPAISWRSSRWPTGTAATSGRATIAVAVATVARRIVTDLQ